MSDYWRGQPRINEISKRRFGEEYPGAEAKRFSIRHIVSILALVLMSLIGSLAWAQAPTTDDVQSSAAEARGDLVKFYLPTFEANLRGNFYEGEAVLVLANHLAHRLWVAEDDVTGGVALQNLGNWVRTGELVAETDDGSTASIPLAFFPDALQIHRDQYAMIASEMGLPGYGEASLEALIHTARAAAGTSRFSARGDLAWTVALLAPHTAPGDAWENFDGEPLDLPMLIERMNAIDVHVEADDVFSCYRFHELYALGVAVDAGYTDFEPMYVTQRSDALMRAVEVIRASQSRGDEMVEVSGRIRVAGHVLEAWYRPELKAEITVGDRMALTTLIESLGRDAAILAGLSVYAGPPDIFVNVPHAIHGLDLMRGDRATPSAIEAEDAPTTSAISE